MGLPGKCLLPLSLMLAVCGTFSPAWPQWDIVKGSLQQEVKVLEETPTRLVLSRPDSSTTLVMTITQSKAADIYGALEARRGSNAYRIWVTTENFWKKPHLADDGGRKFFREVFAKALRAEAALPPQPTAPAPLDTAPPPRLAPPLVEASPDEAPEAEPVLPAETAIVDTSRAIEEKAEVAVSAPAPAPRKNAKRARAPQKKSAAKATRPAVRPAASPPPSPAPVPLAAVVHTPWDSLYQVAVYEMQNANWQQAVTVLEQIQSGAPAYLDVADRLVQARINLSMVQKPEVSEKSGESIRPSLFTGGALVAAGAFVALILLPMIGVIFFSTKFRARYQMFRGEPAQAALLFEKLLARRPGKTKVYGELANAYLLLGRRDEQAMKVYKTVLQLKLATKNHEAITTMVAQKYLNEGSADADMIEVLEDALKAERRKQNPGPAPEQE